MTEAKTISDVLIAMSASMLTLASRLAAFERERDQDAARLDWLERQMFEERDSPDHHGPSEFIGDVTLCGSFGRVFSVEVGDPKVTGIDGESRTSLREAIDNARAGLRRRRGVEITGITTSELQDEYEAAVRDGRLRPLPNGEA